MNPVESRTRRIARRLPVFVASLTTALCACFSLGIAQTPAGISLPNETSAAAMVGASTSDSNNSFGVNLFQQELRAKPGKNVIVSPVSVSTALTLLLAGAGGETRRELSEMLMLGDGSDAALDRRAAELGEIIADKDRRVNVNIANAIFADRDAPLVKSYTESAHNRFDARIEALDFGHAQAALATINAFVDKETEGKISQIVDHLSKDDDLVIVNALYFKGAWSRAFNPNATRKQNFLRPNKAPLSVQMMYRTGELRYVESPDYQAVSLPYGDNSFSMQIFLPRSRSDEQAFFLSMRPEKLERAIRSMRASEGTLELPKFRVNWTDDLNDSLIKLGMRTAFTRSCNLSRMLKSSGHCVSRVVHKTFVDVNEEGTEAAAATAITVSKGLDLFTQTFTMRVDHPFMITITHNDTGAILFIGAVFDPAV